MCPSDRSEQGLRSGVRALSNTRLGVDIGGTFTDLVYLDGSNGELRVAKSLTTYPSPHEGVLDVVKQGVGASLLRETSLFMHATTIGLNAVLQRRGARVGLLTTHGLRDVLEIRRSKREAFNDPLWKPPAPLVPRYLRHGVTERILADGSVHTPLSEQNLSEKLALLLEHEVEAIAIIFLHSYKNPQHELRAQKFIQKSGFKGDIVLSHQVSGEYREYERSSTTVIDAFVRPTIKHYLNLLDQEMRSLGYVGQMLATTSGGGAITFAEAALHPVDTLDSGPAAGAVGTAEVCREMGITYAVMADVGGTSFDTALITNGEPTLRYEGEVAGFPLQTTWVDVRSIGAGGGSIAYRHSDGLLRCGPQSAGSDPGPACYGRGGKDPTSTDAAAVLGMLGRGHLDGGVNLDFQTARQSLSPLAEQMGLDLDQLSNGILRVTATNMANAIRELTFERGFDPREAVLFSFGGAGGIFATLVARELDIARIVVPQFAGVFSAWSLLGQDLARSSARTLLVPFDQQGVRRANEVAQELLGSLLANCQFLSVPGVEKPEQQIKLDIRYVGQEYPLTITASTGSGSINISLENIENDFLNASTLSYGYVRRAPLEIVSVRVEIRSRLPRHTSLPMVQNHDSTQDVLDAFSFESRSRRPFKVISRDQLAQDTPHQGPLIITEKTTTTYVDVGWEVRMHHSGHLILEYKENRT